ncbi:MAG: hypothetical protein IPN94_25610 [Sphingobacteriales bacterium]|nr:hypothetical protein [Sphingobacteriales bacterium]
MCGRCGKKYLNCAPGGSTYLWDNGATGASITPSAATAGATTYTSG